MAATSLGRYELLRLLGRGGMAEVYLARRRVAGIEKRLVIKRIRPERAGDVTFLDLFVREARLSMTLNHQNIVPVFDFGRIGDAAFLAMEHVEGRDLGSTLARAPGPLPPLLAAFIAAECCQALVHAHTRRGGDGAPLGVVHRDVTPRNVLLSWAGEVKLTDFGVAALAGDEVGTVRGTLAYMAPEQARGSAVDARADLYALGLVLWQLLSGTRVRQGSAVMLLPEARAGVLPPLPPGPPDLVAIVERATRFEPSARFADAAAMLAALDHHLVTVRAAAPGPAPARQLADWLRAIWGDAADEAGEAEGAEPPPLLDDVLDPATLRSMADTVAAVAEIPPAPAVRPPIEEVSPAAVAPPPPPRPRSRVVMVLVAVAAVAAVAGVIALVMSAGGRDRDRGALAPDGAVVIAVPPDAAFAVAVPPDAAFAVAAPPDAAFAVAAPPDAAFAVVAPLDASPPSGPRDAATTSSRPDAAGGGRPPGPPVDAAAAAPGRRRVTIGATPWADFTIDDDPTPHQTPETVELPPGRHVIHFANPRLGVERTVTIDVPTDRDVRHVEDLAAP